MSTYRVMLQDNRTLKLSIHLPKEVLLRIYKSFARHNLDYGDIIFDKPNNESLPDQILK